jgi:hypothetical protein
MKQRKILAALLVIVALLGILPVAAAAQPSYKDIDGAWYTEDVRRYGDPDIFDDGSGKFRPDARITRIEFVRLLHSALDISINYITAPNIADSFDDMKNSNVGASELADLVAAGIVEKGGSFRPNQALDREVMIHWIIETLDYKTGGNYAVIKMMPEPFDDNDQISIAYVNDIITARLLNLVNGRGGNRLFPKEGATRAEAVTVVSRLVALVDSLISRVDITASATVQNGTLKMTLTLTNNMKKTVTIDHSSGQKYDFKLFDKDGNNLYTWSADKMFMAVMGSYDLMPGDSITYSETLSLDDYPDLKSATTMTAYLVGTSENFTIDENGYSTEIVFK